MALSANKHRAKEMKRLGWVWWPEQNAWVWSDLMQINRFWITYVHAERKFSAGNGGPNLRPLFSCPIAAAIWISVEYADEIAADEERACTGWEDHLGYALPA